MKFHIVPGGHGTPVDALHPSRSERAGRHVHVHPTHGAGNLPSGPLCHLLPAICVCPCQPAGLSLSVCAPLSVCPCCVPPQQSHKKAG